MQEGDIVKNIELKLEIDPKSPYEKAKKDLIVAMHSFEQLSQREKETLVKEVFGEQALASILERLRHCFK